jgi:hypothetical protein
VGYCTAVGVDELLLQCQQYFTFSFGA